MGSASFWELHDRSKVNNAQGIINQLSSFFRAKGKIIDNVFPIDFGTIVPFEYFCRLTDKQKIVKPFFMNDFLQQLPEEINQLVGRCIAHVHKRFNLELDFTSDTLSVLDFFIEEVVKDEYRGNVPPQGHPSRMNMVHLFAPTFAAYFGAVLHKQFGGRFRHTEKDEKDWRFEFDSFFVRLNPVAIAASVIAKQEIEGLSSVLYSSAKLMPKLQERLDAAPDVSEQEFYSFCTVFESCQIAHEYLSEIAKKDGQIDCSTVGYDRLLGDK